MEVLNEQILLIFKLGPGYTFPSSSPNSRIDYQFQYYSHDRFACSGMNTGTTQASDHLPVFADYDFAYINN